MKKIAYLIPLLAAVLLIPPGIRSATAQQPPPAIYDPVVYDYLGELMSEIGQKTETKTVGNQTMSVTTIVAQGSNDSRYKVKMITSLNDEEVSRESFKVINVTAGTYKLVNKNLGINQMFTNVQPEVTGKASVGSNLYGARIDLYDREYGSPGTLGLYDNHAACGAHDHWLNYGEFEAFVRTSTVDVTWNAAPFYFHWCIVPHEFDNGKVKYGTTTITLDAQSERHGSHAFTNYDGGTSWYSVEVDFVYGSW